MTSEMIGTISRFFFLTLLDEQSAFRATARALQIWRGKLSRSVNPDVDAEPLLVTTLFQQWSLFKNEMQAGQPMVFSTQEWLLPPGLDLGPWLEFRRQASGDEFFTVLTLKVLGLSVHGVALGLKVSEGTVVHRLSRGLRRLGSICSPPGAKRA
jgi:hypothetical protein